MINDENLKTNALEVGANKMFAPELYTEIPRLFKSY